MSDGTFETRRQWGMAMLGACRALAEEDNDE